MCLPLPAAAGQWVGTATVFGALYWKTFSRKDHAAKPKTVGIPGEGEGKGPQDGGEALPLLAEHSKDNGGSSRG